LGSDRNALKVLKEMSDYLTIRNHEGRNVYYLSSLGREVVGVEEEIKWSTHVGHHLMRNDLYVFLKQPEGWKIEEPVSFSYGEGMELKEMKIVPDAIFQKNGLYHFVEVDRTQSMMDNKKKILAYSKLFPSVRKQFGHTPLVIFYTLTDFRKEKLTDLCKEYSVTCKVYTKEDTR
jgi:hypothetical protein